MRWEGVRCPRRRYRSVGCFVAVASGQFRVADKITRTLAVTPYNPKLQSNDAVEAAISRVLAAENAARDAVVRARREAADLAEQAREMTRRLGLHTDRRLRAVRAAFDARGMAEVAALEDQAAALDAAHEVTPAEVARVERAVAALARAMTGDRS